MPFFGDGASRRDYTYVDDIVAGVLAAVDYEVRYLSLSLLADKSPRYIQPWLLPFVFFAVFGVWQLLSRRRELALTALAGIAAAFYVPSLTYERPYLQGCAEAARFLAGQPDSDLLFYNGLLNGDFVYQVRKYDPDKRRMVLRERAVNGVAITRALGRPSRLRTPPRPNWLNP